MRRNKNINEMNDKHDDLIEYDIPTWALSVLINGDHSGLNDEDEKKINDFVQDVVSEHGNAHFMMDDIEGEDDLGFRYRNDIDGVLGANVVRLYIKPDKMNESLNEGHKSYYDHIKRFGQENAKNAKDGRLKISDVMDSIQEDGTIKPTDKGHVIGNEKFDKGYDGKFPATGGMEELKYDRTPNQQFIDRFQQQVKGEHYGDLSKLANVSKEWSNPKSNIDVGDAIIDKVNAMSKEYEAETEEYFIYGGSIERTGRKMNRVSRFGSKEKGGNKIQTVKENTQNKKNMINESHIVKSFVEGKENKGQELTTDGTSLFHYNNEIARVNEGELFITNNGFNSETLFNTLSSLPTVNLKVEQATGNWYLNEKRWNGDWTVVEKTETKNLNQTIKRATFHNKFLSEQDMLNRVPDHFRETGNIFEMHDGENLYRIQWNNESALILQESSTLKMKQELNEMSKHFQNTSYKPTKYSQQGEEIMFNKLMDKMREGSVQKEYKKSIISERCSDPTIKSQILREIDGENGMLNESVDKELDKVIDAIQDLKSKIKSQGMVTNARDEEHLKSLQKYAKELKDSIKD